MNPVPTEDKEPADNTWVYDLIYDAYKTSIQHSRTLYSSVPFNAEETTFEDWLEKFEGEE